MNPQPHPPWCSPARCEAGGLGRFHSAEPVVIPRQRGATARLMVRLWGTAQSPLIELTVGDHGDGHRCRVDLVVAQARKLASALDRALDDAARREPPPHDGFPINARRR